MSFYIYLVHLKPPPLFFKCLNFIKVDKNVSTLTWSDNIQNKT